MAASSFPDPADNATDFTPRCPPLRRARRRAFAPPELQLPAHRAAASRLAAGGEGRAEGAEEEAAEGAEEGREEGAEEGREEGRAGGGAGDGESAGASGYPVSIVADDRLDVAGGGVVAASAMLVCTRSLSLGGALIADYLGHRAGVGRGAGGVGSLAGSGATAAGSGGGHGGPGGRGGAVGNATAAAGGEAYGDSPNGTQPGTLGSGGGGEGGGAGGGVIHVFAEEQLTLYSGRISANGDRGAAAAEDGAAGGGGGGGGGGSGGTIAVRAGTVSVVSTMGGATVTADGGVGGSPGGGGGGGGRLWLSPASGRWKGTPDPRVGRLFSHPAGGAGDGRAGGGAGGIGTVRGAACEPGHGGLLCDLCGAGTAKRHADNGPCEACAPGTVAPAPGQSACSPCGAGLVASNDTSYPSPGEGGLACLPCPLGETASARGDACDRCALPPLRASFVAVNCCSWRCDPPFFLAAL